MIKKILLFLLAFALGFLTHAFIFPDFLANGITDVSGVIIPNPTPTGTTQTQAFETTISYKNGTFSRHNIAIEVGSYLIIRNDSPDHYMWLTSTNPSLATNRNYGESEAVRQRMDEKGQFVVADKNNPSERLVITVK